MLHLCFMFQILGILAVTTQGTLAGFVIAGQYELKKNTCPDIR